MENFPEDRTIHHHFKALHNSKEELDIAIKRYQNVLKTLPGYSREAFNINNLPKVRSVMAEYQKTID